MPASRRLDGSGAEAVAGGSTTWNERVPCEASRPEVNEKLALLKVKFLLSKVVVKDCCEPKVCLEGVNDRLELRIDMSPEI